MSGLVNEKFWLEDVCSLFSTFTIFPTKDMNSDEKLNSITRLVLLITCALYYFEVKEWLTFLLVSLTIILFLKYRKEKTTEGFTVTPTYVSNDFEQTTVAPLFSSEWSIPPPAYDLQIEAPTPVTFETPMKPQSYPYGQYLTRTNLLPNDEHAIRMLNGGTKDARTYANDAFLRNDLAYRENISRIYKKKLARRYRNECNDLFSPYSSY